MSKVEFITTFNPASLSIEGLVKKHIDYLHSDEVLKKVFPNKKFSVIYKRNKNLKELIASSLYPVLLLAETNVTFVRTFDYR